MERHRRPYPDAVFALLKGTPSLRRFFAAFFQSQIGTGAAYVALLLVAYQRLHSGWAIALVLLGEFLPGIVLAPVFGSLADRMSRRRLAILGDLTRAGCFVAIALDPVVRRHVLFALLAGVGTAMFRPAINAALPGMVPPERRSQLTAVFYACVNVGVMIGPAVTAVLLLRDGRDGRTDRQRAHVRDLRGCSWSASTSDRVRSSATKQPRCRAVSVWSETLEGARAVDADAGRDGIDGCRSAGRPHRRDVQRRGAAAGDRSAARARL